MAEGISAEPNTQPSAERGARFLQLLRTLRHEAAAVDVAVYDAIAAAQTPTADRVLSKLSDAANHSKLWLVIAGGLAMGGGPQGRRAARDGVCAIGFASLIVNQGLKGFASRKRPLRDEVALAQDRWVRMPASSSFPSGHTASAFAFATAVGARLPALRWPLGLLAACVGYSRIHTGVHYPGDVLAGAAGGSACGRAVSALLSADRSPRWVP